MASACGSELVWDSGAGACGAGAGTGLGSGAQTVFGAGGESGAGGVAGIWVGVHSDAAWTPPSSTMASNPASSLDEDLNKRSLSFLKKAISVPLWLGRAVSHPSHLTEYLKNCVSSEALKSLISGSVRRFKIYA